MKVEDIFWNVPLFETERLLMRKLTMDDLHDVFSYASDPEIATYTIWGSHRSMDDTLAFLRAAIARYEAHQTCGWGIVWKETGRIIGTCGFVYWMPEHSRAELGYAVSRAYWNRGIGSEAAEQLMKFGFRRMALNRLEARCLLANIRSERVMQKLGMTCEGIIREQLFIKGKYESVKLYAILRSEYEKRR